MSIFLTDHELERIKANKKTPEYSNLYWGMINRVKKYCDSPGLTNSETRADWWHIAMEYLSEAAWACRMVRNDESLKSWLRGATLDIVRRPEDDWIGPFFRDHHTCPQTGYLETAHLSIGISIVLDLCGDIFSPDEVNEIKDRLENTAIPLCCKWLEKNDRLNNWRCILLAGIAVPAAVLDDRKKLDFVLNEYKNCLNAVQPDGSYGESLQYGSYCYFGLMYTYESLVRSTPELIDELASTPYSKAVTWFVHSFFYKKPLAGWGAYPLPRSANFNDSAAIMCAAPDLLMHIATREKDSMPEVAALARWLFDNLYTEYPGHSPLDGSAFSFFYRYSFLSMVLHPQASEPLSPDDAQLPLTAYYSNGDCFSRNSWQNGSTILAFKGAPDKLHASGHIHADLNSLILVHNKERLLADPGHSCYRGVLHEYECSSRAHNTCTFDVPQTCELNENGIKYKLLQQEVFHQPCKMIRTGKVSSTVKRKAAHLISERIDDITVFGSDAAESYGVPIKTFERFCILCGEHVLFIIDRIESHVPIIAKWNWLLNNRDGQLDYKLIYPDRIVARRGNAGMKMFHIGDALLSGPYYGYVHDVYNPLPQQLGEGSHGSGLHFVWSSTQAATSFRRIHGIALDSYGPVAGWHLVHEDDGSVTLDGVHEIWNLDVKEDMFVVSENKKNVKCTVVSDGQTWRMSE